MRPRGPVIWSKDSFEEMLEWQEGEKASPIGERDRYEVRTHSMLKVLPHIDAWTLDACVLELLGYDPDRCPVNRLSAGTCVIDIE